MLDSMVAGYLSIHASARTPSPSPIKTMAERLKKKYFNVKFHAEILYTDCKSETYLSLEL